MVKQVGMKVLEIAALLIVLSFAFNSVHAAGTVGNDTLLAPYNHSNLLYGQTYKLEYYVGNIHGNVTNDTIGLYINGALFYKNTVNADGVYYTNFTLSSQGLQNITLLSTTQSNKVLMQYAVGSVNQLITFLGISLPWYGWILVIALFFFVFTAFIVVLVKLSHPRR